MLRVLTVWLVACSDLTCTATLNTVFSCTWASNRIRLSNVRFSVICSKKVCYFFTLLPTVTLRYVDLIHVLFMMTFVKKDLDPHLKPTFTIPLVPNDVERIFNISLSWKWLTGHLTGMVLLCKPLWQMHVLNVSGCCHCAYLHSLFLTSGWWITGTRG